MSLSRNAWTLDSQCELASSSRRRRPGTPNGSRDGRSRSPVASPRALCSMVSIIAVGNLCAMECIVYTCAGLTHRGLGMRVKSTPSAGEAIDAIPETDLADVSVIRGRFRSDKVRRLLCESLGEQEFARLVEARVDERMVFGINPYYLALAIGGGLHDRTGTAVLPDMPPSPALLALVMPMAEEAADLAGELDPSSQNLFSPNPLKGKIVHKYDEIVLGHTALACSAHCRYCYRLDLFSGSTGKGVVTPQQLRDYIVEYNRAFEPE